MTEGIVTSRHVGFQLRGSPCVSLSSATRSTTSILFLFRKLLYEGMLTSGVSVAEVQQGLDTCACHRVCFTWVSAFLTALRKARSCSGFLRGLLLFGN